LGDGGWWCVGVGLSGLAKLKSCSVLRLRNRLGRLTLSEKSSPQCYYHSH
jgi:hypothetical protein